MNQDTIQIELNGAAREVPSGTSVADLIVALGLRPETVAVELNRGLVRKSERPARRLADADRVEIVTLVGGG